ncbi:hypothetical protein WKH57_00835 [Niallia taxi]|uniref:hypothetical protein n=1 Tax=Niallia taxi TaxID=2499688 RepID=UPI00316CE1AF
MSFLNVSSGQVKKLQDELTEKSQQIDTLISMAKVIGTEAYQTSTQFNQSLESINAKIQSINITLGILSSGIEGTTPIDLSFITDKFTQLDNEIVIFSEQLKLLDEGLETKADINHNHDDLYYHQDVVEEKLNAKLDKDDFKKYLADVSPTPSDYVSSNDLNDALLTKSDLGHSHVDYASHEELNTGLSTKSNTDHTHDNSYSKLTHNHDSVYSKLGHNHDANYANISHNHDTSYSKLGHNHDSTYAKITDLSSIVSNMSVIYNGSPKTVKMELVSQTLLTGTQMVKFNNFSQVYGVLPVTINNTTNAIAVPAVSIKSITNNNEVTFNVITGLAITLLGLTPTVAFASGITVMCLVIGV